MSKLPIEVYERGRGRRRGRWRKGLLERARGKHRDTSALLQLVVSVVQNLTPLLDAQQHCSLYDVLHTAVYGRHHGS